MKISEAKKYTESLITENSSKSELSTYTKFISILDYIEAKEFSTEDTVLIEQQLSDLDLTAVQDNKKKHISKACSVFIAFLTKEFSLVTEGHYTGLGTGLGIALGMSIGMALGTALFKENGIVYGMTIGMSLGLAIGITIGSAKDKDAKKNNLVIPRTQL